jgi:hypothetical protein
MDKISTVIARIAVGEADAPDVESAAGCSELRKPARSWPREFGPSTEHGTTAPAHEIYSRFYSGSQLREDVGCALIACAGRVMHSVTIDAVGERQAERGSRDLVYLTLNPRLADDLAAPEFELLLTGLALQAKAQDGCRVTARNHCRSWSLK